MSLSRGLLSPLEGRTATFLLTGRGTNMVFARTLMHSLARSGLSCVVFDLDAFYSSNADVIFSGLPGDLRSFELRVPGPGSDIEAEFSALFRSRAEVLVMDSLNTLYHLISLEDGSTRGRKLMFAIAGLSYFSRTNHKTAILSMYRRENLTRSAKGRSIANLSEITASVEAKGSALEIRTERGPAWPDGVFSIRIP